MATPRRVSAVNIVNWLLELAVENPVNADVADEDAASPPIFLQQDLSQGRGLSTEMERRPTLSLSHPHTN